jgi:hypothetical protein
MLPMNSVAPRPCRASARISGRFGARPMPTACSRVSPRPRVAAAIAASSAFTAPSVIRIACVSMRLGSEAISAPACRSASRISVPPSTPCPRSLVVASASRAGVAGWKVSRYGVLPLENLRMLNESDGPSATSAVISAAFA